MPEFDIRLFGDDYLYFWGERIADADDAVETIWRVLELEPGMELLDLACGHGRIANRLAARGVSVTGLDVTASFLELARRDAAERHVEVEYVEGDVRAIPWRERFDRVLCWFTSFGYHEDEELRAILRGVRGALRPNSRFLLENNNVVNLLSRYRDSVLDAERDGDLMFSKHQLDPASLRNYTEYVVVRDGSIRRYHTFVRMFTAPELQAWLDVAGFARVEYLGEDGEPLTHEHRRMLTLAFC